MQEAFLHYLWKYQKFNKGNLGGTKGEGVEILRTGFHNHDSGPDFSEGLIEIDGVKWAGSIEIHIKSSDWMGHNHQHDPAYNNVILHVVWEDDKPIFNSKGDLIPTLTLRSRTPQYIIDRYDELMLRKDEIACASSLGSITDIKKIQLLDSAAARRVQRKAESLLQVLDRNQGDWEQTAYETLTKNFGFKLNNEAFERLARALPIKALRKHRDDPKMVEALLFGQAGFLDVPLDAYGEELHQHYKFLSAKFDLESTKMLKSQWKFMRTRPGNFPTVRLGQLAKVLITQQSLFQSLMSINDLVSAQQVFQQKALSYWEEHYDFGKKSTKRLKGLGKSSIENLSVNTVVPLLAAYAKRLDDHSKLEQAMQLLEELPAESNVITKRWQQHGFQIKSMLDSQGSIEQFNEFCKPLKCLSCGVGVSILNGKF